MKISGIFWTVILLSLFIVAYNFGWITLLVAYVAWHPIGIIIHCSFKSINIMDYNDDFDSDEIRELFLEAPYLYTMIHLFLVGFISGLYYCIKNLGKLISSFNNKLDNIEIKLPKKEKKKTFGEFKNDSLY